MKHLLVTQTIPVKYISESCSLRISSGYFVVVVIFMNYGPQESITEPAMPELVEQLAEVLLEDEEQEPLEGAVGGIVADVPALTDALSVSATDTALDSALYAPKETDSEVTIQRCIK